MQIVNAPNEPEYNTAIKCFMAGGIQKCGWQEEFLDKMSDLDPIHLTIFNPRRDDFDINDKNAEREQITWEFKHLNEHLNEPYIFSMYFDASESPQPICFYELGRYLVLMKDSLEDCVISVHPDFKRKNDAIIQTELATGGKVEVVECTPEEHACRVYKCYKNMKWRMK